MRNLPWLTASIAITALMGSGEIAMAANADAIALPDLTINTSDLKFSQNEYDLEAGKLYHLNITSDDGADNLVLFMPEFLKNAWIKRMAIDGLVVNAATTYSFEFDAGGTFDVSFVPQQPGEYEYWGSGYENRGLKGKFVVK